MKNRLLAGVVLAAALGASETGRPHDIAVVVFDKPINGITKSSSRSL